MTLSPFIFSFSWIVHVICMLFRLMECNASLIPFYINYDMRMCRHCSYGDKVHVIINLGYRPLYRQYHICGPFISIPEAPWIDAFLRLFISLFCYCVSAYDGLSVSGTGAVVLLTFWNFVLLLLKSWVPWLLTYKYTYDFLAVR